MSLIYQALRKLGSEGSEPIAGRAGSWDEPPQRPSRIRRSSFVAWMLAAVLCSSVVTAWLLAGRPAPEAEEPVTTRDAAPAPVAVASVESRAAERGAPGEPVTADAMPATQAAEAAPPPAVARLEGPASAQRLSQLVTTRPSEPQPQAAPPMERAAAVATAVQTPVQAQPRTPPTRVQPAPAAPEVAPASARPVALAEVAAASAPPNLQPDPAPAAETRANPFELEPGQRSAVQSQVRDKSLQIARLSAQLTQAARDGDEAETRRLLADLEIEAGGQSSYYLNMLAYVALTREQYDEVEAILGVVLSRSPDDANAGLNMAVAESRTGRLKEARQRLERLALAHPDDSRIGALLASLGER